MTDGTYVFVPYDALLYNLPYKHTPYQVPKSNPKLWEAYDAVFTITVEYPKKTFYQAYTEAATRGEILEKLESDQVSTDSQVMSKKLKNHEGKYFSYQDPLFYRKHNQ